MILGTPEKMAWRSLTKGGLPIPYNSYVNEQGLLEWATPDQHKWFECVKNKRCSYCGMKLTYWIHFLVASGSMEKIGEKYFFTDPGMHPECADYMWELMRSLIRNRSEFQSKKFWTMYVTRDYRLATFNPPPEAVALGAVRKVRINPAPPKELRDLVA